MVSSVPRPAHRSGSCGKELELSVEVVDLAGEPELEARWGEFVPVVMAGDKALCHYHLDADAVRAHFRNFR